MVYGGTWQGISREEQVGIEVVLDQDVEQQGIKRWISMQMDLTHSERRNLICR